MAVVLRSRLLQASLVKQCFRHLANGSPVQTADMAVDSEWERARPYEEIPGPKPLPLIGNAHRFIPGIGMMGNTELLEQHMNLYHKYGKIVKVSKIPGWNDMVLLFDPVHFEESFRKEGALPVRDFLHSLTHFRKVTRKDFYEGIGGLLTENGEGWKKFRTKVNPPMMQHRLTRMYFQPILDVTNEFIARARSLRDSKDEMPEDFANELYKWALESITMVALDKRLGCLEPNLKPDSEPQMMINAINDLFRCWEIMDLKPSVWKIISTPTWRRFVKLMDFFTEMAMKHVNEAIERMHNRPPGTEYEPSVLELLLQRDPNPKIACVMALDMIAAGIDTTSYNVASFLYQLSRNQEKQQYLYEELLKFIPNRNDDFPFEAIEEMKYLKACLKESMRMAAIFTCTMRGTQKETVIGNYQIPKNVNLIMEHFLAGQMEEHFPKAKSFIPERWLKARPEKGTHSVGSVQDYDSVKSFNTNPFVFLPFGFGPRMCIGRRYSELELTVLIAKMVRNFQVEYNYGDMKYSCKFLNKPVDPLKFKLTDRKI